MGTTVIARPFTVRQPVSTLSKLTIGALVGLAGALVYAQAVILQQVDPGLVVFSILMLAVAGLITRGQRWTPLVGALLSAMVVAGNSSAVVSDLSHPESFHSFAFMITAIALATVGCVSGIGATIQNYRSSVRSTPRGLAASLALLVGLCVGAVLVGALPREAGAAVSPELLASLPGIDTPSMRFDQTELKAQVGQTVALRFANTSPAQHSFDVDELNVHVPAAAGKQSLIVFKPTKPGTYTFYCAIPGHREAGMVGKLVVAP